MKTFDNESMLEITLWLEESVGALEAGQILSFAIPDPNITRQSSSNRNTPSSYHRWRAWTDLAELLYCRMLTPEMLNSDRVRLRYQKLDRSASFHQTIPLEKREKYGTKSAFATIHKNEEPAFLFAYRKALRQVKIETRESILDLGINSGDEFDLIRKLVDSALWDRMQLIGIDHSPSAIKEAEANFPEENVVFHCHDINRLDELLLPKADLLLSIGTLQSPGIDFKPLFMSLIQNHLNPNGAVILGFPNCRWIDGEMIYGAKVPHYNFPEMSLVIKDIYFCKKYLQQHRFRVTVTGKDYLFLAATKIGS